MNTKNTKRPSGMILLVVLGMLSLFSMLAITYVVFARTSRNANLSLARADYRGTPSAKLLDDALRQVLRGSSDVNSVMWHQGLLADRYGEGTSGTDGFILTTARTTLRDNPARQTRVTFSLPNLPPTINALEGPRLLSSTFLKVPLQWVAACPEQHDVWNGRVLTFLQGPLAGESFRIVRYIGEIQPTATVPEQSLQYSVTIDLSSALNRMITVGAVTQSLSDWLSSAAVNNGADLCYNTAASSPYRLQINAAPLNAQGQGIAFDGTLQTNAMAAFIPILGHMTAPNNQLPTSFQAINAIYFPNFSHIRRGNTGFFPTGDIDEPRDAPDYNDFHLSYHDAGATNGDGIIPAFHRPSVINHVYSTIINATPLASFTELDLIATVELMQRACGRPLSFRITGLQTLGINGELSQNANFDGSNPGEYGGQGVRTPTLFLDFSQLGSSATEQERFEAWIRWLIRGPWDVDTDADGIADANWVDLNLPLITSREGKLLKMMAAFYIDDLGGRLDLNAVGSLAQTNDANFGGTSLVTDARFGLSNNGYISQGLGYGPADTSLRQFFSSAAEYQRFIGERNGATQYTAQANLPNFGPGAVGDDIASALKNRHRLANHNATTLPGLPMSVFGRAGLGLDIYGNPYTFDLAQFNQIVDDPYEARLLSESHSDRPIGIAEWERLARVYDTDRSSLPTRLERLMPSANPLETSRSLTPRSSAAIAPAFSGTYQYTRMDPINSPSSGAPVLQTVTRRVASFVELVEALAQVRFAPGTFPFFPADALTELFPVEFHHNLKLDLNRPFGNGLDDNANGLVDEPNEIAAGQFAEYAGITYNPGTVGAANAILEQYSPGAGVLDPFLEDTTRTPYERTTFSGNEGRQLLARHLYCLAQLILPDNYVFPNQADYTMPFSSVGAGKERRARILAQWAVNVVDYRDADASMTRFAYDADPFLIDAGNSAYWEPSLTDASDGVVWGREDQEVIMTESLAFHDLRIAERRNPPNGTNRWHQLRTPQGSLFLEFLATRSRFAGNALTAGAPRGNLYSVNANNELQLNLSALSPPDNQSPPQQYPVWRVLLMDPHAPGDSVDEQYQDPAIREQLQYQFAAPAGLPWTTQTGGGPTPPTINRVMWFTNLPPFDNGTTSNLALPGLPNMLPRIYRNHSGGAVLVEGGQYLTVGPRAVTYVGQREQAQNPPLHQPNRHRIVLQPGWTQVWAEDGLPSTWLGPTRPFPLGNGEPIPTPAQFMRNSVTMIAAAEPPASWATMTNPPLIGLNISEPTPNAYYPEPNNVLNSDTSGANTAADTETGAPGFGDANFVPDAYVDRFTNPNGNSPHDPLDATQGPLSQFWTQQPGQDARPNVESRRNWSTAVMQRLANAERPWHETLNPYVTVDWLPIDLTVFTGEDELLEDSDVHFASRQKTGMSVEPAEDLTAYNTPAALNAVLLPRAGRTHFSYHSEQGPRTQVLNSVSADPGYFDYRLPMELIDQDDNTAAQPNNLRLAAGTQQNQGSFATLGYLNSRYGLRGLSGTATTYAGAYNGSLMYANAAVYYDATGAHAVAAPLHTNRDFINAYELTSVPLSSPGQMLQEFTAIAPTTAGDFAFKHLLDFDMLAMPNSAPGVSKTASALLELTGTRTPWVDGEKTLDPADVFVPNPMSQNANILNAAMGIYRAPFNRISTFVEPGKVNLNTASEANVWRGLMWSAMPDTNPNRNTGPVPYQAQLFASRHGAIAGTPPIPDAHPTLNETVPSRFPGVFSSTLATSQLANGLAQLPPWLAPPPPPMSNLDNFAQQGVMRVDATGGGARLFGAAGLYPAAPNLPHNPAIQNYPVARLKNMTTDRSDVYSVRVAIGYFEFDPILGLGREYGYDEGTSQRHRAFYVIDRSIPVAYQPGQDLNTDRCILLRRIIE